jgi:nitroreductase
MPDPATDAGDQAEVDPESVGLLRAMRTTPAVREYTDDEVSDEVLFEILDDARFAPNGANRQAWHVTIVRDLSMKEQIADLYKLGFAEYVGFHAAGLVPFVASEAHWRNPPNGPVDPAIDLDVARAISLPDGTQGHIAKASILLVITIDLTNVSAVDSGLGRLSISAGASVYPFAHNILLAARARGYGGHITSVLARQEPALRTLLRIPEDHALATMLPIGKPVKAVTKLRRQPVESFATVGTFDGLPLRGSLHSIDRPEKRYHLG